MFYTLRELSQTISGAEALITLVYSNGRKRTIKIFEAREIDLDAIVLNIFAVGESHYRILLDRLRDPWSKYITGNRQIIRDKKEALEALDKILSKFHMCSAGYLKMDCIRYINNDFILNEYTIVSLETVESLIKDLEESK